MPRRIQSAALAKGLIGLKGVVNATKVVIGQIGGALTGRGTLAGGPLQTHLLSGSSLGSGALVGALANLFSGALLGSGALAGAPQAGAWYDDPAYATLSHVADLNNDRYAMPTWGSEQITDTTLASSTGWNLIQSGFSFTGGKLVLSAAAAFNQARHPLLSFYPSGTIFKVTYTISNRTSGSIAVQIGSDVGTTRSSNGTFTDYIRLTSSNNNIGIYSFAAGTSLDVDDFSVQEIILTPTGRTYGSELIVNGDFATGPTYGSELIDNGNFATGGGADPTANWVLKTPAVGTETMTISGGTLNLTGDGTNAAYADQNFVTVNGDTYELTLDIATATSVTVWIGTSQGGLQRGNFTTGTTIGPYRIRFTATGSLTWIRLLRAAASLTTVDNVSIKQFTQPSGWILKVPNVGSENSNISGGALNLTGDGTNQAYADQSFTTVASQLYELTFTVGTNAGNFQIGTSQGGSQIMAAPTNGYPVGTNTIKFIATSTTTWIRFSKTSASLATIDNASIRALTAIGTYPKREATFAEFFAYQAASDSSRTYTENGGTLRPMTWGRTNLLTYSQDFTNAAWTKSAGGTGVTPVVTGDAGTAPDSSVTADRLVLDKGAGGASTDLSFAEQAKAVAAGTYTASVYMKTFDGTSKTVALRESGASTITLCSVTGSWQRFSVTTASAATACNLQIILRGTYGTSNSADLLVWGAQVEPHSEATTYVSTTTAAISGGVNAPRFTWVNGKRQLRLENAGTNVQPYSQDISHVSGWTATNGAWTSAGTFNGLPFWTYTETPGTTTYRTFTLAGARPSLSATVYTVSIFLMQGTRRYVTLSIGQSSSSNGAGVTVDTQTWTLGTPGTAGTGFTVGAATLTPMGNGVYRLAVTATCPAVQGYLAIEANTSTTYGINQVLTSTGQTIIATGGQFEQSAFATDYIATTTGSMQRFIETARFNPAVEAVLQRVQASAVVRSDSSIPSSAGQGGAILGISGSNSFIDLTSGSATQLVSWSTGSAMILSGLTNNRNPLGTAFGFDAGGRTMAGESLQISDATAITGLRTEVYLARTNSNSTIRYGDGYYDFVGFSPERLPEANLQALAVAA